MYQFGCLRTALTTHQEGAEEGNGWEVLDLGRNGDFFLQFHAKVALAREKDDFPEKKSPFLKER